MIKKIVFSLIFSLLLVFLMPTAAFGASDYSVDKVNFTAELASDGSALITEEWTVTFSGESDGFSREIMIPEDNFEMFSDIRDVSVSVDGNGCNEDTDSVGASGTYSFEKTENAYSIRWFMPSENETRVFTLRYVQTGVVKIYNDRAYFYSTVVNEESNLLCRDVTVTVKTPKTCFPEDFNVIESGVLAGKKSDGEIVFTADNTAGLVKTGISVPSVLFDTSLLPVIVDDDSAQIIVLVVLCIVTIAFVVVLLYYAFNFEKKFRKRWVKRCRKTAHSESSYQAQSEILKKLSPARIIKIVSGRTVSGADLFIVTFLDLMKRGYIKASADGFSVSDVSSEDRIKRPLDKSEKMILDIFSSDKWQNTVSRPKRFFVIVEKFNKKVPFVSPFFTFSFEGKKIIRRCFELKLSAVNHEFILPEEISDDIFKVGKYNSFDLIVSVLNEYTLSLSPDFEKTGAERYKNNMFVLRETYENGKEITEKEEFEKMQLKKLRKNDAVIDDDFDSQ